MGVCKATAKTTVKATVACNELDSDPKQIGGELAIPISIDKLPSQRVVEQSSIEYKKGWNRLEILHSICAFAQSRLTSIYNPVALLRGARPL